MAQNRSFNGVRNIIDVVMNDGSQSADPEDEEMAPQSSFLAQAPRRDYRGMGSYHSYQHQAPQQAPQQRLDLRPEQRQRRRHSSRQPLHQYPEQFQQPHAQQRHRYDQSRLQGRQNQEQQESQHQYAPSSRIDQNSYPQSARKSNQHMVHNQRLYESLLQTPLNLEQPQFGSSYQESAHDSPNAVVLQSTHDSQPQWQAIDQSSSRPSLYLGSSPQRTVFNSSYTREEQQARFNSLLQPQGFNESSTQRQQTNFGSAHRGTAFDYSDPREEQESRVDSRPLQQGFDRPTNLYQQPSFDSSSQQTTYDDPYTLALQSSDDSHPQRQGFDQPSTYQRSNFGSWPQHTGLGPAYALEQHSRYLFSQPQRQGFDQPPVQHQQRHTDSESRRPIFTRPQFGDQRPPPGFQPLETARGRPTNQIPRPRGRRSRSASPALSSPAGSDFDHWTNDKLKRWNRARKLPTSRNKAELIEQAKTGRPVKTTDRRLKDRGKSARNPIERESFPEDIVYHCTDPELCWNLDDTNEPGVRDYAYYSYELSPPVAEEEPEMDQAQVEQEHGHPGESDNSDDAGPLTKKT